MATNHKQPQIKELLPPELARTFGGVHASQPVMPLGIGRIDALLGGGIPRASVIEIAGTDAAWWLGMKVLAAADGLCAMIDHDDSFFPPGAAALGVDLARLVVVRESRTRQAQWALGRLAREKGIAVTIAWMKGLSDTLMRRLQLAAEESGQAIILLAESSSKSAHWCSLRLAVRPEPTTGHARRLCIEVVKARGAAMPRPVHIEVCDETGAVSLPSVAAGPEAGAGVVASPA
ncbi:MAG: hypothetical protein KF754_00180 [Planctomycetes bacterium]|nr:hypothetical protein [Planctomycetota bacterium]